MQFQMKVVSILVVIFFTTNSFADEKGALFFSTNYVINSTIRDVSRRNLRIHSVSVEKFFELQKNDRVLVSFVDLSRQIGIASKLNGVSDSEIRSTYEVAVNNSTEFNAVCRLLTQMSDFVPQLEFVESYVTIYQNSSINRVWLGKLPMEDSECEVVFANQSNFVAGDIVLFSFGQIF